MSQPPTHDILVRVEQLMTQLLLLFQHQTMDVAHLADELADLKLAVAEETTQRVAELAALREEQTGQFQRLEERLGYVGKRADWFNVQSAELLRVLLKEVREVRATQVCTALNDGPLSAQVLADLVHTQPSDDLVLELPRR
jgi:hypothetical protein